MKNLNVTRNGVNRVMTCILSELLISIEWVVSPNDWCVGMSQTSEVNI